jgi:hypothetical protein
MFVRWSETALTGQLVARLVEGRCIDGKVWQEHVGMLATLYPRAPGHPTALEARDFWQEALSSLGRYQNRLTDEQRDAVVAALHARVALPPAEDIEGAVTDTLHEQAASIRRRITSSEGIIKARRGMIRTALRQLKQDKAVLRQERDLLEDIEGKLARRSSSPQQS